MTHQNTTENVCLYLLCTVMNYRLPVSAWTAREYFNHPPLLSAKAKQRNANGFQLASERDQRIHEDYDWLHLYRTGMLQKLLVSELHKYTDHHSLSLSVVEKQVLLLVVHINCLAATVL